ncbi:MAG: serine/threonine-protein kinase, partial [Thermoanaerobaculia bacterium]
MSDAEQFRRASERLDELLDLEPAARPERLAAIAAADPELAREVQSLLAAADSDGPLALPVEVLAAPLLAARDLPDETPAEGASAGPFRLLRRLGAGGMGDVWLAERAGADFVQQVALKLVVSGPARPDLEARLRRERAILARLEHPHIAHFVDGGLTVDGRLYFAMERVEGEPITDYCVRNALAVDARLRLFLEVCAAVSYAHRSLVVHRDLKPSNVFVTADATVKLLDFGIAKLLGGDDGSEQAPGEVLTELDERLMTPAYAAPEQILGRAVTTATDVYSLGTLLYELLTGERPFAAPSRLELERAIVDLEPKRPSTRAGLATTGSAGTHAAAAMAELIETPVARRELARRLRGDLDAIVLKALRKEPERRYRTVEALAEDLRAFLDERPVGARGDALGYRTAKFARRHRAGVAAAALVTLALIGGLAAALWQARLARREAARA